MKKKKIEAYIALNFMKTKYTCIADILIYLSNTCRCLKRYNHNNYSVLDIEVKNFMLYVDQYKDELANDLDKVMDYYAKINEIK